MPDPDWTVKIDLHNVTEGDATDLAQRIWDEHADELDAVHGDFLITVLRGGKFDIDWEPMEAA